MPSFCYDTATDQQNKSWPPHIHTVSIDRGSTAEIQQTPIKPKSPHYPNTGNGSLQVLITNTNTYQYLSYCIRFLCQSLLTFETMASNGNSATRSTSSRRRRTTRTPSKKPSSSSNKPSLLVDYSKLGSTCAGTAVASNKRDSLHEPTCRRGPSTTTLRRQSSTSRLHATLEAVENLLKEPTLLEYSSGSSACNTSSRSLFSVTSTRSGGPTSELCSGPTKADESHKIVVDRLPQSWQLDERLLEDMAGIGSSSSSSSDDSESDLSESSDDGENSDDDDSDDDESLAAASTGTEASCVSVSFTLKRNRGKGANKQGKEEVVSGSSVMRLQNALTSLLGGDDDGGDDDATADSLLHANLNLPPASSSIEKKTLVDTNGPATSSKAADQLSLSVPITKGNHPNSKQELSMKLHISKTNHRQQQDVESSSVQKQKDSAHKLLQLFAGPSTRMSSSKSLAGLLEQEGSHHHATRRLSRRKILVADDGESATSATTMTASITTAGTTATASTTKDDRRANRRRTSSSSNNLLMTQDSFAGCSTKRNGRVTRSRSASSLGAGRRTTGPATDRGDSMSGNASRRRSRRRRSQSGSSSITPLLVTNDDASDRSTARTRGPVRRSTSSSSTSRLAAASRRIIHKDGTSTSEGNHNRRRRANRPRRSSSTNTLRMQDSSSEELGASSTSAAAGHDKVARSKSSSGLGALMKMQKALTRAPTRAGKEGAKLSK